MNNKLTASTRHLFQDQKMLLTLLKQFQDGILVCDSAGIIIEYNQSLSKLLVLEKDICGQPATGVIRQDDFDTLLKSVIETGLFCEKELEIMVGKRAQKKMYLEVHFLPVFIPPATGETISEQANTTTSSVKNLDAKNLQADGCIIIFHDMTVIRQTEIMRRDFVANVSHELRTPLSAIEGYAETLLEGALEDEAVRLDFVKVIHRHSIRLTHLVSDLLDLSKLESPDYTPTRTPVYLSSLIEEQIYDLVSQKALDKQITFSVELSDNLPPVLADVSSLQQVFTNLLDNAIKYTPQNGKVILKAYPVESSRVQVDVIDNGIGIESKYFSRLFERFYRVDKARSRDLGGTGLGLSIVKHIVQVHGGDIWVSSALNKGSKFSFTLQQAIL